MRIEFTESLSLSFISTGSDSVLRQLRRMFIGCLSDVLRIFCGTDVDNFTTPCTTSIPRPTSLSWHVYAGMGRSGWCRIPPTKSPFLEAWNLHINHPSLFETKKKQFEGREPGLHYKSFAQLPRILDPNGKCVPKYQFFRNGWYLWIPDCDVDGISSRIKSLIESEPL